MGLIPNFSYCPSRGGRPVHRFVAVANVPPLLKGSPYRSASQCRRVTRSGEGARGVGILSDVSRP